jgi:putative endonuclease
VVERLVANEKVASSTLVTRSSLRLKCNAKRRVERVRRSLAKADRPNLPSYGWQASLPMYYVYLLNSQSKPKQLYVGSTHDLRQRLKDHNKGRSPHTAKFRPWVLIAYFAFAEEETAIAFEMYLKSGSGRAFIRRHFLLDGTTTRCAVIVSESSRACYPNDASMAQTS